MRANCGVLFTYFFQTVLCSQHHAPKHEERRMNRITIALACALLASTASAAGADAQRKIANEIGSVASSAVSTYKQQGMAGLGTH